MTELKKSTIERLKIFASRIAILCVLLASWEIASSAGIIDRFFVSSPYSIANYLVELYTKGKLFTHVYATLYEMITGYVWGATLGITIGVIFGTWRRVAKLLDPFVLALYSLPRSAMAPLFILWFGIGALSKVVCAMMGVVFVLIVNTYAGFREVDKNLVNLAITMGATKMQVMQKVILPSTWPWIFAGLKFGIGLALVGAIVGEFISSTSGIGYLISWSAGMFNTAGVFAGLVLLAIMANMIFELNKILEKRLVRGQTIENP